MKFYGPLAKPVTMHLALEAGDFDDCLVFADYQPAEPDTNTGEGIEVYSVMHGERELIDDMTKQEISDLKCEILDYCTEWSVDYDESEADHLYDLARDNS